jgi:hypothetical protein
MCRTRIPIVTAEIATLARSFGMLPDLERDLALGFRALRGLSEAREAVEAYLTMLADMVKQPSAVMEPDHARVLDEHRTLSGLQTLWHKLTETQFFQRLARRGLPGSARAWPLRRLLFGRGWHQSSHRPACATPLPPRARSAGRQPSWSIRSPTTEPPPKPSAPRCAGRRLGSARA